LRAARSGKKWVAVGLVLQMRQRDNGDHPDVENVNAVRVGFTVTKKVGNAVIRNRVRRRLKAAAAEVLAPLVRDGLDLVIIGRMATIKRPFDALKKDLATALIKLTAVYDRNKGKTVS